MKLFASPPLSESLSKSSSVALLRGLRVLRVFRLHVFGVDAALTGRVGDLFGGLDGAVELVGLRLLVRGGAQAVEVREDAGDGLREHVERLPQERAVGVMERGVVYVDDGLVENLRDVVEELRARALELAPLLLVLRRLLRGLFRVRDGEQTPLGGLDEDACALVEFLIVADEFDLLVRQVLALPRRRKGGAGEREEEDEDERRGCLDIARLVHSWLSSRELGGRRSPVPSTRSAALRR